jgi:hypothetical protein
MVQRLKELRRMYRDHHESLDLIDDHLPKRVLGNVCNVLRRVTHLRDLDARDGLVIFGNVV